MSDYSFCLLAFNHQLVSCLTDFRVLVTVSDMHFLISVAVLVAPFPVFLWVNTILLEKKFPNGHETICIKLQLCASSS